MAAGLSVEQSKLLNKALSDLVVKAEVEGSVLSDDAGNILAQASLPEGSATQTIAALGAGSFAATRELAAIIGETGFESIFHQGNTRSIYLRSLPAGFFLLIIFGAKTTVGLVKLYTDRLAAEVAPLLKKIAGQSSAAAGSMGAAFELSPSAEVFTAARK